MEMEMIKIEMSAQLIKEIGSLIADALNDVQSKQGYSTDQMITTTMFMIGTWVSERGIILPLDTPLREALPPLVAGYEAVSKRTRQ